MIPIHWCTVVRLDQAIAASKEHYAKLVASEQGKKVQQVLLDGKVKAAELWKEIQPKVEAAVTTAQVHRQQSDQPAAQGVHSHSTVKATHFTGEMLLRRAALWESLL
jgi:hypothetical protein